MSNLGNLVRQAQQSGACAGPQAASGSAATLCQLPNAANAYMTWVASGYKNVAAKAAYESSDRQLAQQGLPPFRWWTDAPDRLTAMRMGMVPSYPVGRSLALGTFGWNVPWIPMRLDLIMNPDFATIMILLIIVSLLVAAYMSKNSSTTGNGFTNHAGTPSTHTRTSR